MRSFSSRCGDHFEREFQSFVTNIPSHFSNLGQEIDNRNNKSKGFLEWHQWATRLEHKQQPKKSFRNPMTFY